jgi:nicotinate-nucleotide adenylyltransferase
LLQREQSKQQAADALGLRLPAPLAALRDSTAEAEPAPSRRIGILGGTFDPIHVGHLLAAEAAREGANLDEVWLLPANVPPHKANGSQATAEQRWRMVNEAAAGNPHLSASDLELRKGGVSYTIDTVLELKERYPQLRFFFIIGGDMVAYLPKWHRIDEIVSLIQFVGLQRPGYPDPTAELPDTLRTAVTMVPMPAVDISSTGIRELRRQGRSVRYYVPEAVFRYMEANRIYEAES